MADSTEKHQHSISSELSCNDLRSDYDALLVEKATVERTVRRRQTNIEKLVQDIKALYQAREEEEAKDKFITNGSDDNWDPEMKAFELWSCADDVEEREDIIVALKRKKAAVTAECSEVTTLLKSI